MTRPSIVVVVGDVINDVIVRPKGPVAVGTDTPSEVELSPGGSGANQAAWLAALHTPVRFVGRAGAGDAAHHRAALEQLGVEAWLTADQEAATGTIVVLVSQDGERSMFTDRGANRGLEQVDLPARLLDDASLLHVSGYQLFEPGARSAVLELWATAREAGIPTSVDPASVAGLREVGRESFLRWTSGAQLVFPNLDEGRLLTGCEEPDAIAAVLCETYQVVALKLGAAGALVAAADGRRFPVAARPVDVVDSTGAGDAFCAGFLASWVCGGDLGECALHAVEAAARAASLVGARPRSG
ncbi:MAG: PfkB family carbohydrate kinase [Acidimicrobiales bacterium]